MHQAPAAVLPMAVAPTDLAALAAHQPGVTVVDVRTPAEYGSAHIPGSYNVPLDLLPEHAKDLGAAIGGPVVLVCRSGARARQAEQTLGTAGLPRLHVLDGGLAAWEAAGLPVNRGRQRWSMERQVRGVAAGVSGGLLVSALTDSCTMSRFLAKLPYNQHGATCDVAAVVRALGRATEPSSTQAAD